MTKTTRTIAGAPSRPNSAARRVVRLIVALAAAFAWLHGRSPGVWGQSAGRPPIISSGTESCAPGDVVNLFGAGFTPASTAECSAPGGREFQCQVDAEAPNLMQITVPATVAPGIYEITVNNASARSKPFTTNAPRVVGCESSTVAPGGDLLLWGRNMTGPSHAANRCSVKFVDAATGRALVGTVLRASPYVLRVQAPPALRAGETYRIVVGNGESGPESEQQSPDPVTCAGRASDPFGLQVPWASDFLPCSRHIYNAADDAAAFGRAGLLRGDGNTDNLNALNTQIKWVHSHGGGILRLPAGVYSIDNARAYLDCLSGVVLRGDGIGKTIVVYGPKNRGAASEPPPAAYSWLLHLHSNFGVAGITFRNANPYTDRDLTPGDPSNRYSNPFCVQVGHPTDVFFKACDLNVGASGYLSLMHIDNLAFEDTTVEDASLTQDCAMFNGDSHSLWARNTFRYAAGRIHLRETRDCVWENNALVRDPSRERPASGQYEFESGGLECSYSQGLLVRGSSFTTTASYPYSNDGEAILTQAVPGKSSGYSDAGTATAAAATNLSDSSKQWSDATAFHLDPADSKRSVVVITSGPGIGEWRYVVAAAGSTLTVDHPWTILPLIGCRYAVTVWSADQLTVIDNTITGNPRGIELFNGGCDCVIAGNALINSENIAVRTLLQGGRHSDAYGSVIASVGVRNLVARNILSNPAAARAPGGSPARAQADYAVCGAMALVQELPAELGATNIGSEFRGNKIVSSATPNALGSPVQALQDANRDGFWLDTHTYHVGSPPTYAADASGAIYGAIFQDDTLTVSSPTATALSQRSPKTAPYFQYNGYGNLARPKSIQLR